MNDSNYQPVGLGGTPPHICFQSGEHSPEPFGQSYVQGEYILQQYQCRSCGIIETRELAQLGERKYRVRGVDHGTANLKA